MLHNSSLATLEIGFATMCDVGLCSAFLPEVVLTLDLYLHQRLRGLCSTMLSMFIMLVLVVSHKNKTNLNKFSMTAHAIRDY